MVYGFFMLLPANCLLSFCALVCVCMCVCESSGYVLLAQWRIIIALSSGTAKGTQCNASQDHNSQQAHTNTDMTHLPLHALPSRSLYGHPVSQYLLHMMMRELHISRLPIALCRLDVFKLLRYYRGVLRLSVFRSVLVSIYCI